MISCWRIKNSRTRHQRANVYYSINPVREIWQDLASRIVPAKPSKAAASAYNAPRGVERPFCCSLPLNSFSFGKKPLASSPRSSCLRLAGELPSIVCVCVCVCVCVFLRRVLLSLSCSSCSSFCSSLRYRLAPLDPPRLQIVWNFPFDMKGSLRGSFSTRGSQNKRSLPFRRYSWPLGFSRT